MESSVISYSPRLAELQSEASRYRFGWPVSRVRRPNKRFQGRRRRFAAARPEPRRWTSVKEEQMLFSKRQKASSKIFLGGCYPQISGGAATVAPLLHHRWRSRRRGYRGAAQLAVQSVAAHSVGALRSNMQFQATVLALRARPAPELRRWAAHKRQIQSGLGS